MITHIGVCPLDINFCVAVGLPMAVYNLNSSGRALVADTSETYWAV